VVRLTIFKRCSAALMLAAAAQANAAQPFVPEPISVAVLPAADAYRVYVSDIAINHIADGKMRIIDGDKAKVAGTIATGMFGVTSMSPDRKELYVATTYYPRLNRGERVDQVDVYDASTLALKAEIAIPPKHAQMLGYRGGMRPSSDGRFLYLQNATPATSVSVIDTRARKFVTEVPTPGCWIVLPSQSYASRFSTLCGDGTILTATLDADGKLLSQKRSKRFFEPEQDPLFVHAENSGDRFYFVSFKGVVHVANLGGEEAVAEPSWPLMKAADVKAGWRPGGYQPMGLHEASGRLYFGVHPKGKEGSHKEPASEIWVYDLASKKRLARVPAKHAIALTVSRGAQPKLFAIDGSNMSLAIYDQADGKPVFKRSVDAIGDSATQLETQ
jgi:methylamine dehydrogenase heavy chain